jgi:hypothetical protein
LISKTGSLAAKAVSLTVPAKRLDKSVGVGIGLKVGRPGKGTTVDCAKVVE